LYSLCFVWLAKASCCIYHECLLFPARETAGSVEPGVERKRNPRDRRRNYFKARGAAGSGINAFLQSHPLSPATAGCKFFGLTVPGVPLRSTPGSTLSAATRALNEFVNDPGGSLRFTPGFMPSAASRTAYPTAHSPPLTVVLNSICLRSRVGGSFSFLSSSKTTVKYLSCVASLRIVVGGRARSSGNHSLMPHA